MRTIKEWVGHQLATVFTWGEYAVKRTFFGCQMCGQCKLHDLGMTCCMCCPKQLRNGPCGGVRANSHCEVKPEMECRWVAIHRRARYWPKSWWRPRHINPPVDWRLVGTSAWLNLFTDRDGYKADHAPEDEHK